MDADADALRATLAEAKLKKRQAGKQIKAWTASFKTKHGREPTLSEKESIRDAYASYARATATLKNVKQLATKQLNGNPASASVTADVTVTLVSGQ